MNEKIDKKIDKKKQNFIIKKNAILAVIFKMMEYFLSFFTTPILLSCLGNYKYGVYTTALSVISWIYYFDFGIGSGLRNKVSEYIVNEKYDIAHKCVNVAYALVSVISAIAFIIALLFSCFFDFDSILNANLVDENLNIIMIVAIFLACINFVLSLAISLLYSLQRNGLVSGLGILTKGLMVIGLLLFKYFNMKLMLTVVLLEGVCQLVKDVIALICVNKNNRNLTPNFKNIDYRYSKEILGFGIQIFFMQIAALVLNSTDNIIIMKYFGASDVTPYNMCHKYFSIINAFFVAAIGALWTTYTNAYILNDVKYIKETMKKTLLLYVITLFGIIISIIIFKPFMKFYLGKELIYQRGLIILVGFYYALLIFSHIFSSFVHGISKVKITTVACVIGALVNIPISIALAVTFKMGLNGIILGSIISLLINTIAYIYTTISEIKKMEVRL